MTRFTYMTKPKGKHRVSRDRDLEPAPLPVPRQPDSRTAELIEAIERTLEGED
jgi:hypothetical protein